MSWQKRASILVIAFFATSTGREALRLYGQEACPTKLTAGAEQPLTLGDLVAREAARAKIKAGRFARDACLLERAMALYSDALRLHESAEGYALRGRVYAEHGDDSLAWSDFDRSIGLDPAQVEAHAARGWLHAMRGEYKPAMADLNEAIRLDPKNVGAHVDRAYVYRQIDVKGLSANDLRIAKELDPTALEFRLPKGVQWDDARDDARQIVEQCDEALRTNDRNFAAYLNRGFAHYLLDEQRKAIDDYTAALRLNPSYSQGYNYRGLSWTRLGKNAQAIADCTLAIHFDPSFKWPYVNRGAGWSSFGQYESTVEDLNKALEIDPEFNHALRNRISANVHLRKFDEAIVDSNVLIGIQPEVWRYAFYGYWYRALGWLERREYAAAIADLDELARRIPERAEIFAARAWTYYKWGKLDEAIAEDRIAQQLDARFARDYRAMTAADAAKQEQAGLTPPPVPEAVSAEAAIAAAIKEYREHPDKDDWQARVAIDDRLASGRGRLPIEDLENLLRRAHRRYGDRNGGGSLPAPWLFVRFAALPI